jgi:hypothetical protein
MLYSLSSQLFTFNFRAAKRRRTASPSVEQRERISLSDKCGKISRDMPSPKIKTLVCKATILNEQGNYLIPGLI